MPDRPRPIPPTPARNDAAWPELAHLLASAAGCDCQLLALSLAERADGPEAGKLPRKN
jgi:hypothetical protein